jgi:hypothetical protein
LGKGAGIGNQPQRYRKDPAMFFTALIIMFMLLRMRRKL